MTNYFDSHAHITSERLYSEVDLLLARAKEAEIKHIANICTNKQSLQHGLEVAKKHPSVHNVAATTPHDVEQEGQIFFPIVKEAALKGKLVAIGESGLDYFYYENSKDTQQHFLRQYFKLALECQLPIVIHCREAFKDFFKILDDDYMQNGKHAKGVLHCFTGTSKDAHELVERGWYVSLSGIVTFKKSTELHKIAQEVPLQNLLIETDAPYLAPQSKRGKQNEPSYLPETARFISELKGIPVEQLAEATYQNACQFFNLKP